MPSRACPNCDHVLTLTETAEGWCDNCGKKLPASAISAERDPARAAAAPRPRGRSVLRGRFGLWLLLLSGAFCVWGYNEYKLSRDARAEPETVDLAKLESGQVPTQNHVQIGSHVRLYPYLIYSVKKKDENKPDAPVQHTYYPIISLAHPVMREMLARADGLAKKTDTAPLPTIKSFRVLVRTTDFQKVSQVPDKAPIEPIVNGMIINSIQDLKGDEADLIKKSFPDVDVSKILILDKDRRPSDLALSLGLMGAGVLLGLFVIGRFIFGRGE
jgi:hypothetical protein